MLLERKLDYNNQIVISINKDVECKNLWELLICLLDNVHGEKSQDLFVGVSNGYMIKSSCIPEFEEKIDFGVFDEDKIFDNLKFYSNIEDFTQLILFLEYAVKKAYDDIKNYKLAKIFIKTQVCESNHF